MTLTSLHRFTLAVSSTTRAFFRCWRLKSRKKRLGGSHDAIKDKDLDEDNDTEKEGEDYLSSMLIDEQLRYNL